MKILMIGGGQQGTIGWKMMEHLKSLRPDVKFVVAGRSDLTSLHMPEGAEYVQTSLSAIVVSGLASRIKDGEFDIVVNTVATHGYGPANDIGYADFCEAMDTNVYDVLNMARYCHQSGKKMRLVLLSSDAAVKPMRNNFLYNVGKAALEMLAMQLSREWGDRPLKIIAVRPPHVRDTPMARKLYQDVAEHTRCSVEEARSRIIGGMSQETESSLLRSVCRLIIDPNLGDPVVFGPDRVVFDLSGARY